MALICGCGVTIHSTYSARDNVYIYQHGDNPEAVLRLTPVHLMTAEDIRAGAGLIPWLARVHQYERATP